MQMILINIIASLYRYAPVLLKKYMIETSFDVDKLLPQHKVVEGDAISLISAVDVVVTGPAISS